MDGRIRNIFKENIADIIAMNGSSNFFPSKKCSDDPPSIDDAAAPSIDGHFESKRNEMKQNLAMLQKQHGVDVDFMTTRLDALRHEMDTTQRQLDSHAERSPSIDIRTRPSIDGDYAARRSKLVTEKSQQDKLDEITFSQDLLKEDVYQELKDISETTHA
ncbi:hypothetical protein DY000_02047624 [Brassica cretica]|uniref:Uncharacterized protein n=1 Tax=Brassica cretica TaxID=69181 RepID=A0ABQ7EWE2_BRACR|nr:hypothetical protein DY000_02047624 [Brassica cretica]